MPPKLINPYRNTASFAYYNLITGIAIAVFLVGSTLTFFLVAGLLNITDFYVLGGIFSSFILLLLILIIVFKFSPMYKMRKIHNTSSTFQHKSEGSRISISDSRSILDATFSATHVKTSSSMINLHEQTLKVPKKGSLHHVGFHGNDGTDLTYKINISPGASATNLRSHEHRRPESVIIDMKARSKSATVSTISQ